MALVFPCPSCTHSIEYASLAGQKINCPKCGQKLLLPTVATDHTILVPRSTFEELVDVQAATPPPFKPQPPLPPRRREHWRFRCPYCGSSRPPEIEHKVSGGGVAMCIILLFLFFPLFWLGLFIKEEQRFCRDCGNRLR